MDSNVINQDIELDKSLRLHHLIFLMSKNQPSNDIILFKRSRLLIVSHNCFISYKKEDNAYKNAIIDILGNERILGKSLNEWINSSDIDYVMQVIREKYMKGTSVTLYLIGTHSSENEGIDENGYNIQNFMIRELQATLYNGKGNARSGLLGIVLPEMMNKVYGHVGFCKKCNESITYMTIDESTVIREFSVNYWLKKNECGHYDNDGHYCVVVSYDDFIKNPEKYIDDAFEKTKSSISDYVHYKDIEHKGLR